MSRHATFAPAMIAFLLPVIGRGQATLSAIPQETLPPILTPWEVNPVTNDAANGPFPAHRVIGNLYFVGTADYASFLITSPQGHILINPDFESSVPLIQKSVERLGFKFQDIKVILISHAHGDHCAGVAKVKEMTGAQFMVMDADADTMVLLMMVSCVFRTLAYTAPVSKFCTHRPPGWPETTICPA